MADLNTMLRDQVRNGLQAQLNKAVTDGDIDAATKVTAELEKLATATAPKAPPYGDVEIKAELDKQTWWGTDPRRSAKATELGKTMDPKKFATAADFAAALVKAVDDEFKPAGAAPKKDDDEEDDEEDDETDDKDEDDKNKDKPAKRRASDAPTDGDTTGRRSGRTSGPWTKLADAPADVRAEINRTADKWAPKTPEGRKNYIARALEAQYARAQTLKGKK